MDLKKCNNKVCFISRLFYNLNQNGNVFFTTNSRKIVPGIDGVGVAVVVCVGTVGMKAKMYTCKLLNTSVLRTDSRSQK